MGLPRRLPYLSVVLLVAAPGAALGQTVADVVQGMYDAAARSAEGVNDYTLVQSVMGFETTTYFEKEVVDGRPVFRARQSSTSGMGMSMAGEGYGYGDIAAFGDDLIEHGRYAGREDIEGRSTHVIEVDDLSQLDLETPSGPDDMDFVPKSGRIFVDADQHMVRRLAFSGEATTDTGLHEVHTQMDMLDYRDVQGLLIPHRIVMSIEGLNAMVDPEMQAQLEEMMEQLENMDPQQRAMMERMMGPQIEQMRQMMGGEDTPMTVEVTVTEVRVNSGPPS